MDTPWRQAFHVHGSPRDRTREANRARRRKRARGRSSRWGRIRGVLADLWPTFGLVLTTPRLTLRWGESLLDFSPRVSTIGSVAATAMKFTLREIPLSFLVNVFWDFDRETLGIRVVPGEAAGLLKMIVGPTDTMINQPIGSPADITNSALVIAHELRTKINNRLTASGSAIGDPRIRAGAVIRFDGLGPDFSGDYRVASATHSIDAGGYRTTFQVRKEIIP